MDLSGVIFVVLAVAWAVYLIPKTLKQHDEVARSRSLDRFSGSERVLAGREPVNDRDARLVVRPSVPATRSVTTVAPTGTFPVTAAAPARVAADRRTAVRVAARRRRRVLLGLLVLLAVTGVAAYLSLLPVWSPAVPTALVVAFLVLCRALVHRETLRARSARRRGAPVAATVHAPDAAPLGQSVEAPAAHPSDGSGSSAQTATGQDDGEDTVGIAVADLHAGLSAEPPADEAPQTDSGLLWDPLPVTLPTYVTKPKARRTVRTIDLGEPGTWTSGRTQEDAEIAARATEAPDAASAGDGSGEAGRRAVGG